MNLKKTREGGFINERFEKFNRIIGYLILALFSIAFIILLINCFLNAS